MRPTLFLAGLTALGLALSPGARAAPTGEPISAPAEKPDERIPAVRPAIAALNATRAPIDQAVRAGERIVAVGDYGVVLLSDDGGSTFRQATKVPVQSTLTSVAFADAKHGWAAGHDGVILATGDGGDTWSLQRWDEKRRLPLLSVWFASAQHGFAVGQFGQVLATRDGGATWRPVALGVDEDTLDRHFNAIFGDGKGKVWILGEEGLVLRSLDDGASWTKGGTGNNGSLWNGLRLTDGTLMAAGMRGHLYRSTDEGASWQRIETKVRDPFTGLAQLNDGRVVVIGLGGTVLTSTDSGRTFNFEVRPDRAPLSAVAAGPQGPVLFAMTGQVQ